MRKLISILVILVLLLGLMFLRSCRYLYWVPPPIPITLEPVSPMMEEMEKPLFAHIVEKDISIKGYFPWVESLVNSYDSLVPYSLSEQLLIHANPWVIDSFEHSDYYHLMDQGNFVYDQKAWIILKAGDTLYIPSESAAEVLENQLKAIRIDINLPEYKLRLIQGDSTLYTFSVRIGQHTQKYLNTEKRVVDLHTIRGTGFICNVNYAPKYINFKTGEEYKYTRRDDNKTTLMPLIPTLEPEINGVCHGQLIHPTTNPNSLGKAYSHGCIGTREGDAWRLYFYSRPGTPVNIRYDLKVVDMRGDTLVFPDVYELSPSNPG